MSIRRDFDPGLLGTQEPLRTIQVPVQAIVVLDDDGARPGRVTPAQFRLWVEFAGDAFRAGKIEFAFDESAGFDELRSTVLNNTEGAADANWPAAKQLGDEIAARHPGRLVVLVRHGPGPHASGAAFAGTDHDFVVMGGFDDMIHCGHPQIDALAHEIGHYLGLPHTFVGDPFPDLAAAEAYFAAHGGDPRAFDGDGFTDTPPDPGLRLFECERRTEVELLGTRFVLPRRNLMSYYDERDSLSPQQLARARWVLERRRRHAMRLPANRAGPAAVEAEALAVGDCRGCSPSPQDMDGFGAGRWSGDAQLFCTARPGAILTLRLPVSKPGSYRVVLYATLAPDFGAIRCSVNRALLGPAVDLYAPLVLPTGAVELGRFDLDAGIHQIAFEVVGHHPDSTGHHFGLDAIELMTS